MANVFFTGLATPETAQVDTLTVGGTVEADDVFIITLADENNETLALSVVAGSTNVDTVAATITTAFNLAKDYRFAAVTAAAVGSGGQLTLTADTAGVPFYATPTTTEDGGGAADDQTFTSASTTANISAFDWNVQANWLSSDDIADLPGETDGNDIVYIEGDSSGNAIIKYGLNQTGTSNNFLNLFITRAQVGENGEDGRTPTYLQAKTATADINYHNGPGTPVLSSPVNLNTGAVASIITVHNTGTNSVGREPSVNLLVNEVNTDIFVKKGSVGVATHAGEATSMDVLDVSFVNNIDADAKVFVGKGITLKNIVMSGGLIELSSGVTVLASIIGGTLDTTKSTADITIAAIKLDPPGVYKHSVTNPAVTLTAKIEPVRTTGKVTYSATEI